MSLAILAFTATDRFYLALPCVFVAGAAMTITGTGAQTLIQAAVDPGMRGRVMALYGMIFRAGPAVGRGADGHAQRAFRAAPAAGDRRGGFVRRPGFGASRRRLRSRRRIAAALDRRRAAQPA